MVVVVAPEQAERVVREAHAAGIRSVWMQEGSESPAALSFCAQHGMTAIDGACVMIRSSARD